MQLLLARLELLRLGERLLKQLIGHRRRRDRVEHQPDALGQLIKQRLVRRAERRKRCQLKHRAHRSLEEDRQHDDVQRRRLAQTRVDLDVIRRHLREQDPLLLKRTLADEPLSEPERAREMLALLIAIAGLKPQHRLAAVVRRG